jgi:hypothetical protein
MLVYYQWLLFYALISITLQSNLLIYAFKGRWTYPFHKQSPRETRQLIIKHSSSDLPKSNGSSAEKEGKKNYEMAGFTEKDIDEMYADKMSMIKELYWDLCEGHSYLTREKFMGWEDVKDLIDDGTFDMETMKVIFEQVEVSDHFVAQFDAC